MKRFIGSRLKAAAEDLLCSRHWERRFRVGGPAYMAEHARKHLAKAQRRYDRWKRVWLMFWLWEES